MRKVAIVTRLDTPYRRAMIYAPADGGGVYLFHYLTLEDGPCAADCWYADVAQAEEQAAQQLGIAATDWQMIPDPQPGCQHDRLAPVRLPDA